MKKLLIMLLAGTMLFCFAACANNEEKLENDEMIGEVTQESEVAEETKEITAETLAVGNTITTPFAEMTVSEAAIANDIQTSVSSGSITYISGPDAKEDTEYVYIRGTLKNTSKSEIVMVNISGTAEIDGYTYDLDRTIIESDGNTTFSIEPLKTYTYTLYAEVPNELAQSAAPCVVNFGFNENFGNIINIPNKETKIDYNYTINIAK